MSNIITAIFDTQQQSESALNMLDQAGFTKENVTILMSEDTHGKHFGIKENSQAEHGAVIGAAAGGLVGAIYLALATVGTVLIPGLSLLVSGALIGGLAGLGAGAAAGGFIGAMVGLGVPEHEAKLYEQAIRKGAVLVAVQVNGTDNADQVKLILKNAKAQNVTFMAA